MARSSVARLVIMLVVFRIVRDRFLALYQRRQVNLVTRTEVGAGRCRPARGRRGQAQSHAVGPRPSHQRRPGAAAPLAVVHHVGQHLADWESVDQSIEQGQQAASSSGKDSAFILQAFTFGDNKDDGEAVGVCTPSMNQQECYSKLDYPSASTQLQLRNEVLEHSSAKLNSARQLHSSLVIHSLCLNSLTKRTFALCLKAWVLWREPAGSTDGGVSVASKNGCWSAPQDCSASLRLSSRSCLSASLSGSAVCP